MRAEVIQLIKSLTQKTANQNLNWSRTSSESQYKLIFPNNSFITIDNFWHGGADAMYVSFVIHNEHGDSTEGYSYHEEQDKDMYKFIKNLHAEIRGDNRIISEMMDFLNN